MSCIKDLVEALDATDVWFEPADTISAAGALPQRCRQRRRRRPGRTAGSARGSHFRRKACSCESAASRRRTGESYCAADARHAVDLDDRLFALALMELLALAITQSPDESLADLAPMPAQRKQ